MGADIIGGDELAGKELVRERALMPSPLPHTFLSALHLGDSA